MTKKFFSPLSFVAVFGSGIRDPRSGIRDPRSEIRDPGSGMGKNQDPGSGINIPDPPHWLKLVCNVNIVYGNLKSENSQYYAQKPHLRS